MKILKDIRFYLVLVSLSLLALMVNYLKVKDELTKCQTENGYIPGGDIQKAELMERCDSLRNEDFIKGTIIGRYEITLEHFKEVNPKVAKEFEDWMSHNTE